MMMSNVRELKVLIEHDAEDGWWIAESELPGLSLGDNDATRLLARIQLAALDLLELNAEWNETNLGIKPDQEVQLVPVFKLPLIKLAAYPGN